MIRFAAFAVLIVNCIFLVSSAPKKGLSPATLKAFDTYHDMYKNECSALPFELVSQQLDYLTVWGIDQEIAVWESYAPFRNEIFLEIKCIRYLMMKYKDDFDKLRVLMYLVYLSKHYAYAILSQDALHDYLEHNHIHAVPEVKEMREKYAFLVTRIEPFSFRSYEGIVQRMTNLKIMRLAEDIKNTQEALGAGTSYQDTINTLKALLEGTTSNAEVALLEGEDTSYAVEALEEGQETSDAEEAHEEGQETSDAEEEEENQETLNAVAALLEKIQETFNAVEPLLKGMLNQDTSNAEEALLEGMSNLNISPSIQDTSSTKEALQEGTSNIRKKPYNQAEVKEALRKIKEYEETFISIMYLTDYESKRKMKLWLTDETQKDMPGGHEEKAHKIENAIRTDLPGVDFPVRKPLYITDDDAKDLISEFGSHEEIFDPEGKIGGSRAVKIIQLFMESDYEEKKKAAASTSTASTSTTE